MEEASVAPGQPYWRLIKAEWRNEAEAGGTHHIYVEVLDENSRRLLGQPVTVTWRDGVYPGETENKAPPDFGFNYPMSAAGYSYRVRVEGLPSDQLHNLGLGDIERRAWTIHTSYWLTFQRATR